MKPRLLFLFILSAVLCRCGGPELTVGEPPDPTSVSFCPGDATCPGKSPWIRNIKMLQQQGARPRWSPRAGTFLFDRKNPDGYYDVYESDLEGNVVRSLTENRAGINQKNNGNPVWHPGGNFVIFLSEVQDHLFATDPSVGDPGVGLFCNLWAMDPGAGQFWQLTDIPIKQTLFDGILAMATVNPHFSEDGSTLIWTERYAEGGHNNWGTWRVKAADFVVRAGGPGLENERVVFTPSRGNYVTYMGAVEPQTWIFAGNLDGQHEYGMDLYTYDLRSGRLRNLLDTPLIWEEDASVSPGGKIVYMTNIDSPFLLDFSADWVTQPLTREYYLMNADGTGKERLSYFNDPGAPEYLGQRVLAVASDFSPDGRYLAATVGVDFGDERTRDVVLKVALIEFTTPR